MVSEHAWKQLELASQYWHPAPSMSDYEVEHTLRMKQAQVHKLHEPPGSDEDAWKGLSALKSLHVASAVYEGPQFLVLFSPFPLPG